MKLKNFGEQHSLVVDKDNQPYAYDHSKKAWFDSQDDDEFDLHPIAQDGNADFDTIIKKRKKDLTPQFVKLIPEE